MGRLPGGRPIVMSMLRPEHRTILAVLGLAALGQGARVALLPADAPPGQVGVHVGGPPGRPLAHRDSATRLARPLGPGERVDFDRAGAADLARVPGIGPRLARQIVADRERRGPFGGLAGLDRVPGVGPGLLARLEGVAAFSAPSMSGAPGPVQISAPASVRSFHSSASGGRVAGRQSVTDLNAADSIALLGLPGIGPGRAREILAWRALHGPFRSVHDLARVPRVGERVAQRVWREVYRPDP